MYRRLLVLIASFLVALPLKAQVSDSVTTIYTADTIRLNPSHGMIEQYKRPPIYDIWFKRIAQCEDLPLPPQEEIDKIKFVVVNAENFALDSLKTSARFDALMINRRHVMIVRLPSVWDYGVIAHEFLHFVLWYNFGNKYEVSDVHPEKYFLKCNIRSK